MAKKKIPEYISPDELANNSYKKTGEIHKFILTDQEVMDKKSDLNDKLTELFSREDLLSKVKTVISKGLNVGEDLLDRIKSVSGGDIKEIKKEIHELNVTINQGYEFRRVEVYHMDFQDKDIMGIYSKDGDLLDQRQLESYERQTVIKTGFIKALLSDEEE